MWWPFQWLFIYVLGGFTCIPLMIGIAIWWVMTYGSVPIGDDDPMKWIKDQRQRQYEEEDSVEPAKHSFAGYLTVRRQFRPNVTTTNFIFGSSTDLSGAEVKEESTSVDEATKQQQQQQQGVPTVSQRLVGAYKQVRKTQVAPPKELFYCVLKGSVLFLYDDDKQTECVAAISVEKYHVGMEKPEWKEGRETRGSKPFDGKDAEMFGKRNACVMRLVEKVDVKGEHHEMENAPWFFFSTRNTEMEDIYIALLQAASTHPTVANVFSFEGMKQLVNTIDTEPDPLSTRWLNAFVGRIFLGLNQTRQIEDKIIEKIKLKLTKVQRPAWLGEIVINEVHVGKTPPIFHRPMLKDLTPSGSAAMEIGLKYRTDPSDPDSGVRFIASTQAIIPLGYKQVTVQIMVEARLKGLEGNLLLKIKEPPSNRIWWGFTTPPKLDVEIKPVVQDRKLNLSVVLNQLDSLLRRVISESIVLPAMDDIAFFDTSKLDPRGGIFSSASKYSAPTPPEEEVPVPIDVPILLEDSAEETGLRKRIPTKSLTLDHQPGDKDEPIIGISRVDTAPANLAGSTGNRRASAIEKWFAPVVGVQAESAPRSISVPPDVPVSSIAPPAITKPVVVPAPQPAVDIESPVTREATALTAPSDTSLPSYLPSNLPDRAESPVATSATLLSAVKLYRAGDKKALQDMTKTGMDGVKKGWMSFAAKHKAVLPNPIPDPKPMAYRPLEDERDAAAGPQMEVEGIKHTEGGRTLKERLDAAAHIANAENVPGRPRSGTGGSSSSKTSINTATNTKLGNRPSLLSSPSKSTVPSIGPSSPSMSQTPWTSVPRASTDMASTEQPRKSSTGSTVSTQPGGMGRGMVVPRVVKRPGEVTALGSSPGVGLVRHVSGEEGLKDSKDKYLSLEDPNPSDQASRDVTSTNNQPTSDSSAIGLIQSHFGTDPAAARLLAAMRESPIRSGGKSGDLAAAIEADRATPPISSTEIQASSSRSTAENISPERPAIPPVTKQGDLASAIEADTAMPGLSTEDDSVKPDTFKTAADWLSTSPEAMKLSTDAKLELYGLYKYATKGKANGSRPSMFDPAGRAKYDAWVFQSAKYSSGTDAKERYMSIAEELGWEPSSQGPKGMGVKVSMMAGGDDDEVGSSEIHEAVISEDMAKVRSLVKDKKKLEARDEYGNTPLHLAADRGMTDMAKLLLESGADKSAKDEDGQTALDLAKITNRKEIIDLLNA